MFKLLILTLLITTSTFAKDITIAVAANVSYAIDDLIKEFNKHHPDTKVKVILGGSGKLTAQISFGAPYQLFMSANMLYPDRLYKQNIAITKPLIYAQGSLAILSSTKRDFSKGIEIIKKSSIKKIAIANPKTAPYGKATIQALKNAKLYKEVKRKFIYGESISQTVSYTVTATDLGFIAKSSLYSPKMSHFKEHIHWSNIDSTLYTPIKQGVVILKEGRDNQEVRAFYDFLQTKKAKQIFVDFGYEVPKND